MLDSAITSKENKKIRHLAKLLKEREYRYECLQYVAEGRRLLDDQTNCQEIYLREDIKETFNKPFFRLSAKVFNALSATETPQGLLALCSMNIREKPAVDGNYLLLDGINEPGNLGALARSALAFNYRGIIVTAGSADPYGPKAVRAAMGAFFKLPIIFLNDPEILKNELVLAADLNGKELKIAEQRRQEKRHILVIGSEAHGISPLIKKYVKKSLRIPISPKIESLNAAVAGGILMYVLNC